MVELIEHRGAPYEEATEKFETVPVPVLASDADLPGVLQVPLVSGRWLDPFDEGERSRTAVIGMGLAREFDYLPGEVRSILLDDVEYAVVGVLHEVELEPAFDNAVFIPFTAADADFVDDDILPNKLYVRAQEGSEQATAEALKVAINLGGPDEVQTELKSEALELAAQSDRQLQLIVVSMGLLAIIVGGIGIANVMSISVIQRSSEIGIRRAHWVTRGARSRAVHLRGDRGRCARWHPRCDPGGGGDRSRRGRCRVGVHPAADPGARRDRARGGDLGVRRPVPGGACRPAGAAGDPASGLRTHVCGGSGRRHDQGFDDLAVA